MYFVWTKQEYNDLWSRQEATDEGQVRALVLAAAKAGEEVLVTQPVEVEIQVKIKGIKADPPAPMDPPAPEEEKKEEEQPESEDKEDRSAARKGSRG